MQKLLDKPFARDKWRCSLLELLLLSIVIIALYINTIVQMVGLWSASDTYAHGFIVPFITLWLIWRKRDKWLNLLPVNSTSAWFLMLCAAGLWLAGDLVAVNAVTQVALVSLIVLSVPAILGWKVASVIAFPLSFLFFAVPIGDFMLPTMMDWTADFTVVALRLTGIPVYREGLNFVIPSGSWSVVEACSGIRYLIASLTVGCLFAYLNYQSFKKRILFIGVSIVVPLIANWLRAYMIVLIGHYSGNELATGVDHIIYGWLFFGVVIGFMLYAGARWADFSPVNNFGIIENSLFLPNQNNNFLFQVKNNKKIIKYIFIIIIVALPHILNLWFSNNLRELPVHLQKVIVVPPWRNTDTLISDWTPAFQHATAQSHTSYALSTGEQVGLHISYYRQQDYTRKLVTSTNDLVNRDNQEWIESSRGIHVANLKNNNIKIKDAILSSHRPVGTQARSNLKVWQFYWVNGIFTANDVEAKIQGVLSRISGNGDDSAHIIIYTPFISSESTKKDMEVTNDILNNFLLTNSAALKDALEKTVYK